MPRGDDLGTTHQTRRTGPTVDIDLAAMPVLPRSTSHRHWIVFRPDGINPATTHPLAHQLDKV
jgi:hypothetical protein